MFSAIAARRDALRTRYAEPHRAYHAQSHIEAMLADLERLRPGMTCPDTVELATWYHDAIYDPAARDNEARSAALLLHDMAGLADPALLDRAALLIHATATHRLPPDLPPGLVQDAATFLDMDMAVLGADAGEYDAYERGIAAEFVPVFGAARYHAGRADFLRGMLERPHLFLTARFREALEPPARLNLRRALTALA